MNRANPRRWIGIDHLSSTAIWLVIGLLSVACTHEDPKPEPRDSIDLRWVKAYPKESRADVETGLMWGLSHLGAELRTSSFDVISWRGNIAVLNIGQAGIDARNLPAWRKLLQQLKASEEYRATGALDIGRFLMLTLGSSQHYYALTGAAPSYATARLRHRFGTQTAAIVESGIARGHRLIEISDGPELGDIAFIAHEGSGSIPRATFKAEEFEIIDFMTNGQMRIAMYDGGGKLKSAASAQLTGAGKPANCLWCHESGLHEAMNSRTDVEGHYSRVEFDRLVRDRRKVVDAYRDNLDSRIDFSDRQAHTFAELLYLSFEEPSLERLAGEWNLPIEQAKQRLRGVATHAHAEFEFLGREVYHRSDVDGLAPYRPLRVPTSARQPSSYEPDLLRPANPGEPGDERLP